MAEALSPAGVTPQEQESDECSVCVAVHVRPLIDSELLEGCDSLLQTTSQQPQVRQADLLSSDLRSNFGESYQVLLLIRLSPGHIASHTTMSLVRRALLLTSYTATVWNRLSVVYLRDTTQQVNTEAFAHNSMQTGF